MNIGIHIIMSFLLVIILRLLKIPVLYRICCYFVFNLASYLIVTHQNFKNYRDDEHY